MNLLLFYELITIFFEQENRRDDLSYAHANTYTQPTFVAKIKQ
jgi:hypothetical protein